MADPTIVVDYAAHSKNIRVSEKLGRLDASVFTSTLPATKRNGRTISTRATDVIFERVARAFISSSYIR